MAIQYIVSLVGLVSPAGSTVATLNATGIVVSQDEGTAPFTTARVSVSNPSALQFAMMKPGAGYLVSVLMYPSTSPEKTATLLKITDRNRTSEGNVELQLASAELDLMAFTPSSVDRSNWFRQNSVTSIMNYVFGRVFGATGWARYMYSDAYSFGEDVGAPAYPTFSAQTNLLPDGGFEYGTAGYTGVNATVSRSSTSPHSGTYVMGIAGSNGSGTPRAELVANLQPGKKYTMSGWFRMSAPMPTSGVSADARKITVAASINGVQYTLFRSAQFNNTTTWTQFRFTFTMPPLADAGSVILRFVHGPTSSQSTVTSYWDDLLLLEGDGLDTDGVTPVPFFNGDTTDGTAGYNYDWQGDAGGSASTRTPIINRDPEALTWSPGQSAWDFLQPILQASGIRLWSPGYDVRSAVIARIHYATNAFGLNLTAPRALDTYNLFELNQVDSWSAEFSDGTPMYADQVIIHYAWTDNLGVAQEAYDVYPATGKKPYYLDKTDTPFPGIGRAQGIYNRISARATVFQGTTWFDRGIEPGRQLSITSNRVAGGSALGYIEAVTHDVGRGTAEFRTKQTVAFTSASWFSATGTWASQTGSWAADS